MAEKTSTSANDEVINYRGVKAMPYIIGNETFDKLGTMSTISNLLVYLRNVFKMKSITATTYVNVFQGTSNIAPLFGAFLSDTYFGRFKTLGFASLCSFLGMTILALTAAIPNLHPPTCIQTICVGPTTWQIAVLLAAMAFMVIGAGGIRPCNLAFGADQFDPNTESGKKGINSFFNWYYFTFTFAMMIAVTVIVYVQSNVNWAIGLAIPAGLMFLSVVFFFLGSNIYVKVKPEGSPLTSVIQVIVAAIRKRKLNLPHNPALSLFDYVPEKSINTKLPRTTQFRWLNKAAIMTSEDQIDPNNGSAANPWRLCSVQQVEKAKFVIRVIPLWASGILYFVPIVQQQTYAILQALQSDRRFGSNVIEIPAASFIVFYMLSMTLFIPIYDRVVVPFLEKLTGKQGGITVLQRMGTGIFDEVKLAANITTN